MQVVPKTQNKHSIEPLQTKHMPSMGPPTVLQDRNTLENLYKGCPRKEHKITSTKRDCSIHPKHKPEVFNTTKRE